MCLIKMLENVEIPLRQKISLKERNLHSQKLNKRQDPFSF